MTSRERIAETLKQAMAAKGLGNTALARATGLRAEAICKYRRGAHVPSKDIAAKLEAALGLNAGDLICADRFRGKRRSRAKPTPEVPTAPVVQEPAKPVAKIADGYGCPKITPKAHGPVCLLTLIRCPLNTPEQRANCARLGKLAKPVDLDDGAGVYFAGYGPRR